jgi:hypothetical protein
MTERKAQPRGVIVAFPRPRLSKKRRILSPPPTRICVGAELRLFLERMANGGRA